MKSYLLRRNVFFVLVSLLPLTAAYGVEPLSPNLKFPRGPVLTKKAPVWHWSTFDKQASECACRMFSKSAFAKESLTVLQDVGPVLLAGNNEVLAEVVCMSDGQRVTVSAFSSDSAIAERIRNNVREHIVRSVLFDTCP